MSLARNDPRHGTLNGYKHLRCRCAECREANAEYSRTWDSRNPKKRRAIRVGVCPECGGPMSVGNGVGKEVKRCGTCERERVDANLMPCGTRASYRRGCRCRACTDEAVKYQRKFKTWKRSGVTA